MASRQNLNSKNPKHHLPENEVSEKTAKETIDLSVASKGST